MFGVIHLLQQNFIQMPIIGKNVQYGRRDCAEITGVPPSQNENPELIALKIFNHIGVPVEGKDIVACHRLRKARGNPALKKKFLNRKSKEMVMRQRKNLKGKCVSDICPRKDYRKGGR